jgi:CHASE3 domain sensor protein
MPINGNLQKGMGMDQVFINWGLGIISASGGFLLNALWQAVKDLQKADKELADKVSAVDKVVAGDYQRRDELQDMMRAIFLKLDRIEDKLEKKADR